MLGYSTVMSSVLDFIGPKLASSNTKTKKQTNKQTNKQLSSFSLSDIFVLPSLRLYFFLTKKKKKTKQKTTLGKSMYKVFGLVLGI